MQSQGNPYLPLGSTLFTFMESGISGKPRMHMDRFQAVNVQKHFLAESGRIMRMVEYFHLRDMKLG